MKKIALYALLIVLAFSVLTPFTSVSAEEDDSELPEFVSASGLIDILSEYISGNKAVRVTIRTGSLMPVQPVYTEDADLIEALLKSMLPVEIEGIYFSYVSCPTMEYIIFEMENGASYEVEFINSALYKDGINDYSLKNTDCLWESIRTIREQAVT